MATKTAKPKREKLKLLVNLLLPEGGKAKAVIDRIKEMIAAEFPDGASVKKAPAETK